MAAPRDAVEDRPRPVVLVTGCSTGIGREAVAYLERAGFLVVATARRLEAVQDLASPGRVEVDMLDVTKAEDRKRVVEAILARHGRIDALVNNAGYGAVLAVEDTDAATMQAMFATNVFAPNELARLVLPTMRKQGNGRIVNVASIAGHIAVPMMGAYCGTKFALRAMTQAMDVEVRPFGVRALLVEPGFIKTQFGTRSSAETVATVTDLHGSPYAAFYRRWAKRRAGDHGAHPNVIARLIVKACASQSPSVHNFGPFHAKAANVAKRVLPDAWLHAGFRAYFRSK
ncbi:MAG TPA: SDR family oxidoreductase [Candidatus Thermoplasmatota archaeon]|nr:SDR family oxidoreductase [Candidatus Thermoplasmatota archaeon]